MADAAQIRTDTTNPEVATLLMAHALAVQVATGTKRGKPDVDTYLATFAKVYKGLKAVTAALAPSGLSA
jgi:hypothetical protein